MESGRLDTWLFVASTWRCSRNRMCGHNVWGCQSISHTRFLFRRSLHDRCRSQYPGHVSNLLQLELLLFAHSGRWQRRTWRCETFYFLFFNTSSELFLKLFNVIKYRTSRWTQIIQVVIKSPGSVYFRCYGSVWTLWNSTRHWVQDGSWVLYIVENNECQLLLSHRSVIVEWTWHACRNQLKYYSAERNLWTLDANSCSAFAQWRLSGLDTSAIINSKSTQAANLLTMDDNSYSVTVEWTWHECQN